MKCGRPERKQACDEATQSTLDTERCPCRITRARRRRIERFLEVQPALPSLYGGACPSLSTPASGERLERAIWQEHPAGVGRGLGLSIWCAIAVGG